jgi:hypothetical protein
MQMDPMTDGSGRNHREWSLTAALSRLTGGLLRVNVPTVWANFAERVWMCGFFYFLNKGASLFEAYVLYTGDCALTGRSADGISAPPE